MSEEKPKRKRSHELRDYLVTLKDNHAVIIQSDDLRNARRQAIETYGEMFVVEVKHASKRRDYNTLAEKAEYADRRLKALNEVARRAGFDSWRNLEAAVKSGKGVTIPAKS